MLFDTRKPMQLHPFQRDAKFASDAAHFHSESEHVLEIPTGGGKTMIGLDKIKSLVDDGARGAFIVPRKDLATQTYKRGLEYFFLPSQIGCIQGDHNDLGRSVTVATVQSLSQPERLDQFVKSLRGRRLDVLFFDECHYSITPSWVRLAEQLLDPEGQIIGISATPYRSDNISILRTFRHGIKYTIDFSDLMLGGYLADVDLYNRPTDASFAGLDVDDPTDEEKVGEVQHHSNRYQVAYHAWMELARGKRTLIFAQDLDDAWNFQRYFQAKGIECAVVTGKTAEETRADYYAKLAAGTLPILIGFNVLTTGLDIVEIECIIMGRATKHRGLIIQMIGRGLRLAPHIGKKKLILINLTDKDCTLLTMGKLIGLNDVEHVPSVRRALAEKVAKEEKVLDLTAFTAERAMQHLKEIHLYASNAFTGGGWVQDRATGDYVKDYGQTVVRAERSFNGYHLVSYTKKPARDGAGTTLSRPERLTDAPISAEAAMAKGHQHVERQRIDLEQTKAKRDAHEALLNGTSEHLDEPVSEGQISYLKEKRKLPYKQIEKMTQAEYARIVKFMQTYGASHINGHHITWSAEKGIREWHESGPRQTTSPKKGRATTPSSEGGGKRKTIPKTA